MSGTRVLMSKMQDLGAWQDWARLREFLARQLTGGRLSMALGAGVSVPFGLPGWGDLTDRAYKICGEVRPANLSLPHAAERLLTKHCGNDELEFARLIRKGLYDGVDLSMVALRKRDLLAAIGCADNGLESG